MEDSPQNIWPFITTLLPGLVLLLLIKFIQRRKATNAGNVKLPPGSRGWPIIGHGFSWYKAVASSHPSRFVEQQEKRYGKIFSCNLFGKRAVVSVDPDFNRFVMQNEGKLFQSSYPKSFRDLVGKNGVINAQGDQQRKLHSTASNMMRMEKLKLHSLNDVQKVMRRTLGSLHHNQVISLQDTCRKVAIELMVNQILGLTNEPEVNVMAQLFSDFVDGCLSVPINLPGFAYHRAMQAREAIILKINQKIAIHRRQEQPSIAMASSANNGVLGRLLEEENLPDDVIADFVINLLFAGNETTAKTMVFAVYFLTHCPKAFRQLHEEQQRLKKRSSSNEHATMLSWEDYKDMPFTHCVIDETLRLAGIAIWLMREAKENVQYKDYVIPKGCFVVPFISAVHLNETIYGEALTFNPWRWMAPENQEKRNWRSSPFFAPFGGGARFCPGAELGRLQIALFLHYFVTELRWNQLQEDRMCFFPSARLANGFQIQLQKISQSSMEK